MKKHSLALTILLTIFVASSLTCTFSEEALPKNYAVIQFGTYEQDGNLINGTEPIEWYVLDIRDGRALLISKYVLDWQYYDKNSIETLWSQSFLKKWLFDEFYMNAFSDAERVIIKEDYDRNYYRKFNDDFYKQGNRMEVDADYNVGEPVFLMDTDTILRAYSKILNAHQPEAKSVNEAEKNEGIKPFILGFPTQYCLEQGARPWDTGACNWWTRNGAFFVGNGFWGPTNEIPASVTRRGVRPSIWIDINGYEDALIDEPESTLILSAK